MTATMTGVDWRRPIERAITRADKHGTDLVSEIVGVIEAQLTETPGSVTSDAENARLREELEQLDARVVALHAELAERDKGNAELADEIAKLKTPVPHRHQYVWADPDDFPGPCACGKPNPRDPRHWVDDPDDDAGDSTVQAPWDQVISRVRDELEGVWPDPVPPFWSKAVDD